MNSLSRKKHSVFSKLSPVVFSYLYQSWLEIRGVVTACALICVCFAAAPIGAPRIGIRHAGIDLLSHAIPLLLLFALGATSLLFFMNAKWRVIVLCVSIGTITALGLYRVQELITPLPEHLVDKEPDFSLVHYNVLGRNPKIEELTDHLQSLDADVAVLLEAPPFENAFAKLKKHYPYHTSCNGRKPCDMTIFSKFKMDNIRVRTMANIWENRLTSVDLTINDKDITIVGAHFTKPYYDYVQEAESYRFGSALRNIRRPIVVVGDFNMAPWSTLFRRIIQKYELSLNQWPIGTWPSRLKGFGVPIDHVLTKQGTYAANIIALPTGYGSNHRGLKADIYIDSE